MGEGSPSVLTVAGLVIEWEGMRPAVVIDLARTKLVLAGALWLRGARVPK